jgi:hypothetical protein
MGGGENSITLSNKNTEIKQVDKLYMVDNNNDERQGTQSSSSNTTEDKRRYNLRPRRSNTQVQGTGSDVDQNTG